MVGPADTIIDWLSWYRGYEQKALFLEPDMVSWMCHMATLYHMRAVYLWACVCWCWCQCRSQTHLCCFLTCKQWCKNNNNVTKTNGKCQPKTSSPQLKPLMILKITTKLSVRGSRLFLSTHCKCFYSSVQAASAVNISVFSSETRRDVWCPPTGVQASGLWVAS